MRAGVVLMNRLSRGRGRFRSLPLAQAWTAERDLPAPQRDTFMAQWQRRNKP
jgi:L-lactate dehydrogenase complex protein LldF